MRFQTRTLPNFSDASFNQALQTLESVREYLSRMGLTGLRIRFCFCERRPEAVERLRAYAEKHSNFEIHVFAGSFEANLNAIADACSDGFTFTFIDPTGWDIHSAPVLRFLRDQRGEFLLNFMAEHVNRHVGWDQVSASFGRFLADPDWKEEFVALPEHMSNEQRVLHLLKKKIKASGAATYLPDIPILKPRENRIKMRLILGTHSRKGLEVFRDVHSKVELSEMQTRNAISEAENPQLGLWSKVTESEDQQRAIGVGSASAKSAAISKIEAALLVRPMRFEDLAALAMEECAMRLTNVKDLLVSMRTQSKIAFDLPPGKKKPQSETVITLV